QALRQLEQDAVGCEDADPGVEPGEPVDVDHEQRERMVRKPGPEDLPIEHGGERLAVEQAREQVELRYDVRLAEVERSRDRRARALHEVVQPVDVLLAETP